MTRPASTDIAGPDSSGPAAFQWPYGTSLGPCSSCGATVLWAKSTNGVLMPLDAERDPNGPVVLCLGVAHVLQPEANPPSTVERWRTHFDTCPRAAHHRRPRPRQPRTVPKPKPAPEPKPEQPKRETSHATRLF